MVVVVVGLKMVLELEADYGSYVTLGTASLGSYGTQHSGIQGY